MKTRIIGENEVRQLLTMPRCIRVMDQVLRAQARGECVQPVRSALPLPSGQGLLGLMPASLGSPAVFGVKVVSVFPGNQARGLESHQGAILLFDPEAGQLLAVIDAGPVTEIRTGAVSAVATRSLARQDASVLAILGSGTQAHVHLKAMAEVLDLKQVRVWSRTAAHARSFASWARRELEQAGRHASVSQQDSVQAALDGADVICTVTHATEPLLEGPWIAAGTHINAVGASVPPYREIDTATVARSRVIVDERAGALAQADCLRLPIQDGVISEDHLVGELGEVLTGTVEGRQFDEQVTLFKSLGLAIEDLAAAHAVYSQAQAKNLGSLVDFSSERES